MELLSDMSSSRSSPYSIKRTATILAALSDAQHGSSTARDGYHFDTPLASLI